MPRKPGQRTGRDEGLVLNVIRKHPGPKARAYSQGPTQKFGFAGGIGAPNPVRVAGSGGSIGRTVRGGGGGSAIATTGGQASSRQLHWHRDEEGTITRGEAPVEEEVEHIHRLSHEHMRRGHIAAFEIPHFGIKGEGEILAYGHRGVTVRDGEGKLQKLFYHELNEVRKPEPPEPAKPKPKKKAQTKVTANEVSGIVARLRKWWKDERGKKAKAKKK